VIAKFNVPENEVINLQGKVEGFPTVMWYPKGNKEGLKYE